MTDEWKKWKFAGIYAIKNKTNNKIYVGQSNNLARRIDRHIRMEHPWYYLYRAVQKYGWEMFDVVILERINNLELLTEREQHWIDTFKTYDPQYGYNMCPKAQSCQGRIASEETRAKASALRKGQPLPETARIASRMARLGSHPTDESRAKMRAAQAKRAHTEERTKLLIEIVITHPKISLRGIARKTGMVRKCVTRLLTEAGWRKVNDSWTPPT